MSLAQGYPSTFSNTEETREVLHNLDNETKKIYSDVNNFMAADGHAHTGNGSDGAKISIADLSINGALNEALGTPIASASTINLTTATGNFLHITGTAAITAVTLGAGMRREVIFDGILTLTHHATNNNLPGAANITTAAGDRATYISDGTTVYCIDYVKANSVSVGFGTQGSFKNLKITNNTVISFTGNTTNLSTSVASVSSTAGLVVGMFVYGAGIQTGTTIATIGSGTITLSINATITATGVSLTAGYCNTRTDITADQVVLFNNSNSAYLASSISLTADISVSGANGLDTGTKSNSTWYAVYVIAKADGTKASLLSLSSISPTMPTDYLYKARIGWTRTDSSGNLLRILQLGNKAQYVVTTSTNTAAMPLIANGVLGNVSTPTWVATSISSFVPPTTKILNFMLTNGSGNTYLIIAPNASYSGINNYTNPPIFVSDVSTGGVQSIISGSLLMESTNIYIASNSTICGVYCRGWEDNI